MTSSNPMSIFDISYIKTASEQFKRDKIVYCGNCGEKNHIYRDCIQPIISLGVILFRYSAKTEKLEYLLVRRKDSIGYVEFLRGRYASTDKEYIEKLFNQMSTDELDKILTIDYDILWKNLWMEDTFKIHKKHFTTDYEQGKKKYDLIKNGYIIDDLNVDIDYFVKNINTNWNETEWGLPKGRRNIKESDYDAAKREFMEESGIPDSDFSILENVPIFIEEYIGSDNVKYRHIYYLARYFGNKECLFINTKNKYQVTEISEIKFFEIEQCIEIIREYYSEKREVLNKVDNYIKSNHLYKVNYNYFRTSKYSPILINTQMSKSL